MKLHPQATSITKNKNKEFKNHIKIWNFHMTHDPHYEISNKSVCICKTIFLKWTKKIKYIKLHCNERWKVNLASFVHFFCAYIIVMSAWTKYVITYRNLWHQIIFAMRWAPNAMGKVELLLSLVISNISPPKWCWDNIGRVIYNQDGISASFWCPFNWETCSVIAIISLLPVVKGLKL